LIELLTLDNEVPGPVGIVYSTSPRTAIGIDGRTYYVKGCNDAIAFAEVCGCRLAAAVGLPAPDAQVGYFGGDFYAAVAEVKSKVQNVAPWLNSVSGISNPEDLFGTIVVDCWLANDDRNMGNLVGTRSVTADAVRGIVLSTACDVPVVTWAEASIDVLLGRAQRIQPLAEEIWQRN
jgi:hypothetical protein